MFKEYQLVVAARDLPQLGIEAGTNGTVLLVYDKPYSAYEVEFFDLTGNSLAVCTVTEEEIAPRLIPELSDQE